ncbi:hypothetical protein IC582_028266 [Cucumis melo]
MHRRSKLSCREDRLCLTVASIVEPSLFRFASVVSPPPQSDVLPRRLPSSHSMSSIKSSRLRRSSVAKPSAHQSVRRKSHAKFERLQRTKSRSRVQSEPGSSSHRGSASRNPLQDMCSLTEPPLRVQAFYPSRISCLSRADPCFPSHLSRQA